MKKNVSLSALRNVSSHHVIQDFLVDVVENNSPQHENFEFYGYGNDKF